jgi:hypothetical protein
MNIFGLLVAIFDFIIFVQVPEEGIDGFDVC